MKYTLLLLVCLAPSALLASTIIDGVIIPESLMNLARSALANNSTKDAVLNGSHAFKQHPFFNKWVQKVDFKALDEEAAKLMVQMFTREEIAALVKFQTSPEGRSIAIKMPHYQQMVGGLIQNGLTGGMNNVITDSAKQSGAQSPGVRSLPRAPQPALQGAGGSTIGQ